MKKNGVLVLLLSLILVLSSLSVVYADGHVNNSKTFSGFSSDFGLKYFYVKTYLDTSASSGMLNWTDVHAYNYAPLGEDIGNGEYDMSKLVTTYIFYGQEATETYYNLDSVNGSYLWPSGVYWYIMGGIVQNLEGTGSETAYFTFFNDSFTPCLPYANWTNTLSIAF